MQRRFLLFWITLNNLTPVMETSLIFEASIIYPIVLVCSTVIIEFWQSSPLLLLFLAMSRHPFGVTLDEQLTLLSVKHAQLLSNLLGRET